MLDNTHAIVTGKIARISARPREVNTHDCHQILAPKQAKDRVEEFSNDRETALETSQHPRSRTSKRQAGQREPRQQGRAQSDSCTQTHQCKKDTPKAYRHRHTILQDNENPLKLAPLHALRAEAKHNHTLDITRFTARNIPKINQKGSSTTNE